MPQEVKEVRSRIRRQRGRRCVSGINACVSVFLAAALVVMLNYIAFKYLAARWDISSHRYYALSDKTLHMLEALQGRISILAFVRKGDSVYDEVRFLLKEYEHAASRIEGVALDIAVIDPDRDLARAAELGSAYEVDEPNTVVFEAGERRKYVKTDELFDYERSVDFGKLLEGKPSVTLRKAGFRGEQVFSSAIFNVAHSETPKVYFLAGHGEHAIDDFGEQAGYSGAARLLRRDNADLETLLLAEHGGIPADCAALVVAGPRKKISQAEIDILSAYLKKNGRLMVLLDEGVESGLEKLLKDWEVGVGAGVVVGPTLTGRELFVARYGDHPITRRLEGITTMFYRPRSITPLSEGARTDPAVDRPEVTVLASSPKDGWEEVDLAQIPPKFDATQDTIGPVGVAVAVEKGSLREIDVEIKPTRMVVVGDSDFMSNNALRSGVGGNTDFFMSCMNWLLERESLLGISPKSPGTLNLDADNRQLRSAFLAIVLGVPAMVGLLGIIVWFRRRR